MKYIYIFLISLISFYLVILLYIYFNQRNLLYHPKENNYLNDPIKFNHNEVFIEVEDKIRLKAWIIEKNLKKYKTLVFFHGNAGNLFNRVHKLNKLNDLDINILIFSWRGFSGNSGNPTESNLYKDGKKIIDWLNDKGVDSDKIILYGESLGTGVVVELGQSEKFNKIILESPYTSIERAAKIYYPYLPIKYLLKDKYNSLQKIDKIKVPILIMHGKKDSIIPFEMGVELYQKANEPKYFFFPENDNHMMNFDDELMKNLKDFINQN